MLLFLLGFPSGLVVDHGLETSRPPLAKRIYSAPYGRTDDMVMNVMLIGMGAYDKGVLPFRKPHGQFIPQPVRFTGRDLARYKGLPQMIRDHVVFSALPPCILEVFPFGQKKFSVRGSAVAFITCDEPPGICLIRVLHIVDHLLYRAPHRAPFSRVDRNPACRGHITTPIPQKSLGK